MSDTASLAPNGFSFADALPRDDETCLIIDAPEALALLRRLPVAPAVVLTSFPLLDRAMLEHVRPTRVVIPLISARMDAVQALTRLARLGFRGTVCILSVPLPDPALVLAELVPLAPDMTLHLLAWKTASRPVSR